jgi:hypothetical protein
MADYDMRLNSNPEKYRPNNPKGMTTNFKFTIGEAFFLAIYHSV